MGRDPNKPRPSEAVQARAYRARKAAELALLPEYEREAILAERRAKKSAYDASRYDEIADKKRVSAAAWYAAHPEEGRARSNARYAEKKGIILPQQAAKRRAKIEADPTYTRKEYENFLKRRAANPGLYRATRRRLDRQRRERDPETYRLRQRERYWANPEKFRTQAVKDAANRRARKLATGTEFTVDDVQTLRRRQQGKCAFCLKALGQKTPHVDHYIPLVMGGSNDLRNLRLLHAECNLRKHAKHPLDFALQNGLLCW